MPRSIATLRDFSGGINTQFNPRDIQDNQLGYAQDIMGDRVGSVRTMGMGLPGKQTILHRQNLLIL